jgi:serine protease AprX
MRLSLFIALLGAALLALGVPVASAVVADRDADGIFDDLEQRLGKADANEPVRVIVVLHEPATRALVRELSAKFGGFTTKGRFTIIDGFAAEMTKTDVAALARLPEVDHLELDQPIRATNNSAQDSFGVTKARLDSGHEGDGDGSPATYSSGDLVAAVIDTGIDSAHRDLDEGKVIAFADCLGQPCALAAPLDPHGHGTHVAATIAGEGDARSDRLYRGVAPAGALVGVRALDAQGNGFMSDAINALSWVRANRAAYGIEVVNLSLGGSGCSSGTDAASVAVNNAVADGLVVVVSAGNEGPAACTIAAPAAAANAITVGAMADLGAGGFKLAPFSSRGPTADGRVKPDIVAPGVSITSAATGTLSAYAAYSGTSMAAPFVAGVALLMLDANGGLTPADVKARLGSTAIDWGASGTDSEFGAGRLDAYAAVAAAGAPIAAPPAMPAHLLRGGTVPAGGGDVNLPLELRGLGYPIAVTVTAPTYSSTNGPFFSVQLLGPSGAVVASGTQSGRHVDLTHVPSAIGSYVLRVGSSTGGATFVADVSGGFAAAPIANVPPVISGTPEEGALLTATTGTWSGEPPFSYAFGWQRCDTSGGACGDIPGTTAATYVAGALDVGRTLRVVVTATDSSGATAAASDPTPVFVRKPDRQAPLVKALMSAGRRGALVKLLYRVTETSGRAQERIRVFRGTRLVRTRFTSLARREVGRTYYVYWRAPRTGRYRFCVRATDAAGNTSAASCAAIRLR